jgi:hypothetical protein
MVAAADLNARRDDLSGNMQPSQPRRLTTCSLLGLRVVVSLAILSAANLAHGVKKDSPEVLALVDKGLAYLDKTGHFELGGKCLVALAYYKRGRTDHPRVGEALDACRKSIEEERRQHYNYGKCLAIIFLCELGRSGDRELIGEYAEMLRQHQKPHGGFGYLESPTGDTSQTQYAALAYWEMLNHGIAPDAGSVQRCLNWLMRTRDPSGVWGYQGVDPGSFELVKQVSNPGVSMAAAGMSGTMILGNAVGLLKSSQPIESGKPASELPPALRAVQDTAKRVVTLPSGGVDPERLADTIAAGRAWYSKNFTVEVEHYQSYYLYSVERYMSFQEFLDGTAEEEPAWYNKGFELLKAKQSADGSWSDQAGSSSATAFSILFLLRSTQQSIQASLGEGTLVGGRGLPRDLSKLRLRGAKLVVEQRPTEVEELLGRIDDPDSEALDELLDNPAALQVVDVGADQARRLQQVIKSGKPAARLLAVRALGELRNPDHAPTLIFALTDPDKRVVRAARDGLRSISRHFEGFGPPDNFEDAERKQAIERWKEWYRTVWPDAAPLP